MSYLILLPIILPIVIGSTLLISSFKEHLNKNNDYENKSAKELKVIHVVSLVTLLISAIVAVYVSMKNGLTLTWL